MRNIFLFSMAMCASLVASEPASDVSGWRGDGNGKYPHANPPLDWGRVAKSVKDLSAQARKPNGDTPPAKEAAIPDGVIRQWLVLGPLPVTNETKAEEIAPNAENLSPDENEKLGDKAWQSVTLETSCLDLCATLKVPPEKKGMAAFAHTYIYSPSDRTVAYTFQEQGQGIQRVWLNGTVIYSPAKGDVAPGARIGLSLKKGWNRLLVLNTKTIDNYRKSWWITGSLYGDGATEYDTHGIVWMTPVPCAPGSSAPVIMGDRLFFTLESSVLACANKADGKLLWMRTLTYYDFATDEERKAHPEVFAELAPLVEQLKKLDQADVVMPWKSPYLEKDFRATIDYDCWGGPKGIFKGMAKVSHEKYNFPGFCEAGFSCCTPVTDGHFVYTVSATGIVACYDRDGNRQWMTLIKHKGLEHGYGTSPLLVDGKLIVYFANYTVLDAKTGQILSEHPARGEFFGTGCVVPAGNEKVLYFVNDDFTRFSDGKALIADLEKLKRKEINTSFCSTPVVDNGLCYMVCPSKSNTCGSGSCALSFKLNPLQGDKVDPEIVSKCTFSTDQFPYYYECAYCASPLVHEGLLYCLNDIGILTVVDMAKGEVAYQKQLDLEIFMPYGGKLLKGGASSSPTLAGKYIYIVGDLGTTIVLEPGRTFKQVARLRMENLVNTWPQHQEAFITNPVFEGERMYYRADSTLYCIGKN
jgi:hypothetical protein